VAGSCSDVGDAVDVNCVIFHDECPGLGATLCGSELFVVVVVVVVVVVAAAAVSLLLLLLLLSSSSYDQKIACSDHITLGS
jgi:hypothetical protein